MKRLSSMLKSKGARRTLGVVFLAFFLYLLWPVSASLAQDNRFGLADAASIGLPQNDLRVAIVRIIQILLGFLGIVAVSLILYGGFIWMTSGGDPAKLEKAKKILINTVIGIIIILSAYTITAFIIRALMGFGGGGGGWGPGGGGRDDFGRWGIGVGPIESVYPAPGQVDVPINTIIAVTFKEGINPQTICGASDCNGIDTPMTNIEICQVDNSGLCQEEGEEFSSQAFSGSLIKSVDSKTFTIIPKKYLGLEDFQDRRFKVTLKSGIETKAGPGKSVFSNLFNQEYPWQFTTSGELDLDPPEIVDITGVYPYPDKKIDTYGVAYKPTPTNFSITFNLSSVQRELRSTFSTTATNGNGTSASATLTGKYSGIGTGRVTVSVDSTTGEIKTKWPGAMGTFNSSQFDPTSDTLNIGPYGLVFKVNGVVARGNSWTFNVRAQKDGDKLELKYGGNIIKTFIFDEETKNPVEFYNKLITETDLFETCGNNCVQTKQTGAATAKYDLYFNNVSYKVTKTSGLDQQPNRQIQGQRDAYRNTIIQINFNEAINPATVADYIAVNRLGQGAVTGYSMEISNQYKTVELIGSEECGTNSCGDKIFCWPVEGQSQFYGVSVISATLMSASDSRCSAWGGADDGHGRCVKDIGGQKVFYPFSPAVDGVVDMSWNSFNGSFDTYQSNNKVLGIAQGQAKIAEGGSGRSFYNLNTNIRCEPGSCDDQGSRVVSYGVSTPVFGPDSAGGSGFGDDFVWGFFMSDEIDNRAPLLKTNAPVGDENIESPSQKVDFYFDRLMRSSTLKPGWNYGSTAKDKSIRYLVLQTISPEALAVGYWVEKNDIDNNFDGWADYTKASLSHNNFDLATKYGPLAGSGLQSLSQNCFLPSAGPNEAAKSKSGQECGYSVTGSLNTDCAPVRTTNPASYGYLNCQEIKDAKVCPANKNNCKVLYYDRNSTSTDLGGSWVITKDYSDIAGDGSTGCCFGTCVAKPAP